MRTTIFLLLAIGCSTVYAGPFCPEETNVCTSNTCKGTEKELLGTHTWYLLHKIAETVPPTPQNRRYFGLFMDTLAKLYPCKECRKHMQELLQTVVVDLSPFWMCRFHNMVNHQLDKPAHNCSIYQ